MFIIACDYDGTIIGEGEHKDIPNTDIINKLKEFKNTGLCEIALWTCRGGKDLDSAISRCRDLGIEFDSINENTPTNAKYLRNKAKDGKLIADRKILADFYLDNKAFNLDIFLKIDVVATCQRFKDR